MEYLNERIKHLRKDILKMNQSEFAEKLGLSQRTISWSEQPQNNVPDSNIKSICNFFNINENWLRNGIEPIFIAKEEEFSLDDYARERGASKFDLKILKAYLNLDQEIRNAIMEQFKKEFGNQEGIYLSPKDTDSDILTLEEANKIYEKCPKTEEELDKLVINIEDKGIC